MKIIISKVEFEAASVAVDANNSLINQLDKLLGTKSPVTRTMGWNEFCGACKDKWGDNFSIDIIDYINGDQAVTFNIPSVVTVGLLGRTQVLLQQLNAIMPAVAGVVAMVKGMIRSHDDDCTAIVRRTMEKTLKGPTSRVLNPKD